MKGTIAALALQTGMRLGEILDLKWGGIDRANGFIRVGHASKAHKVRYIPINSAAMRILNGLSPFVGPQGPNPHVFVNTETGGPYTVHGASHAFSRMAKRAGLTDVTFHTLRHTVVSRLVQAGVSERRIMSMIGHSSTHMVGRYAHLAPTSLRGVAEVLMNPPGARQDGVRRAKELAAGMGAM